MKPDSSVILFQKYFNLENRLIEIELKNHTILKGKFIGYYRGKEETIIKWHFIDTEILFGRDQFGFLVGQLIKHKDILRICFTADNSIMYLNGNL